MANYPNAADTISELTEAGNVKALRQKRKTIILAMLAGAFIALGAYSSLLVRVGLPAGLAKILAGVVFSSGLIMITLTGAELFTGNILMTFSVFERKIGILKLFKNWAIVYFGNFIGALIALTLILFGTSYTESSSAAQNYDFLNLAYGVAAGKVNLTPLNCFLSGILCNLLVCMAVYAAQCAKDVTGKILGIVFPITIFIIAGYEHCVANMFFIPMGAVAEYILNGAVTLITFKAFVLNMVPVTLGNIIGAFLFLAVPLWKVYKR